MKSKKTILSIIKEEMGSMKKFEVVYVPFNEIPGNLRKQFNDNVITPEEYSEKLQPYYRTKYSVGNDMEEAILKLGADFEDYNEVIGAEEVGVGVVAESKKKGS
jgi:hypothetical protein